MGIRDDLVDIIDNFSNNGTPETGLGGTIDTTLTIVFFAVIVFGAFIVIRGLKHFTSFAGDGETLGSWKLHIMGKSLIKGNLNIHEHITEAELDMLESMNESDIVTNTKSYRERLKNKELFLYDYRITDYDEAFDLKGGRDSIIVTSVPMESEQFSWNDDKGDRSLFSPTLRNKSKNIFCFINSEYHPEYVDPYGKLKDIYELVIIPKNLEMKMKDGKNGFEMQLVMSKLKDGVSDVLRAEYLKTIAESFKRIDPAEKEVNRLRDKNHDLRIEISDVYKQKEDSDHLAIPEPFIGSKIKRGEFGKGSILGIVMLATALGGIGYGLPELVPALRGVIQPMIGVGIAMALMFLMVNMYYDKKPVEKNTESVE